ncbi:Tat pathway signal sequence [uncultured Senegalimassilia sp.]|uniref:Tat pathway signal sequence n=1 Tax=uncultured Senegalimassilia sp. TaxID=1714350 RepID=UPI002587F180|nr:Tat pathway signal sequence [uncultured Senegalimassilia sp.]
MKQTSGFESLIDALKQSGFDMGAGFGGPQSGPTAGSEGGSQQGGASPFGGGAGNPFAGFGGHGGSGGKGGDADFSFGDKMGQMSKKALVILAILLIVVLLVAYWWFHPPINIHSTDTWLFVAVFVLLPLFVLWRAKSRTYETGNSKVDPSRTKAKAFKIASWVPVVIALVGVLGAVASLSIFPGNAAKYANVLQTQDADFAQDIQQVDYSEIPIIDRDSAALLGNRAMGNIPEYVSQFEIAGTYSQINYQGTPVRVSPLGYADLFKWLTNRQQGIPAYALVDMTTQDAQIVKLGDRAIFYSRSEPLARNIDRYVQLKYPFYMFDEKSFEIDEDGQPWWICPVQTRTIGLFGGTTIDRVVMVNATTGECTDLAIDDVPQWVDRAYPAELLIQQYNWSGKYQDGWLNSWLGQKNVVQTTPGTDGNVGYNYIAKDDDVWVYTGVTSATADNSIVGFVLVNQRTAESHYYPVAGATEESAMQSAEGAVQNLRYSATFPILINVSEQPTYFMALKDNAGTVKKFAMVDIQHYQNVATGDTVAETQKSYQAMLATSGALSTDAAEANMEEATGVIRSMTQAVMDGNSHFYVTLDGVDGIFDFAIPGQLGIVGYKEGDTITFKYVKGDTTNSVQEIDTSKNSATIDKPSSGDAAKTDDKSAETVDTVKA